MNGLHRDLTDCRVVVEDHPGREFHCVSGPGCHRFLPGHDVHGYWDGAILKETIDSRTILSVVEATLDDDGGTIIVPDDVPIVVLEHEAVPVLIEGDPDQPLPGFMTGQGGGTSGGGGASDNWDQPLTRGVDSAVETAAVDFVESVPLAEPESTYESAAADPEPASDPEPVSTDSE